jgi:hypothetical protein
VQTRQLRQTFAVILLLLMLMFPAVLLVQMAGTQPALPAMLLLLVVVQPALPCQLRQGSASTATPDVPAAVVTNSVTNNPPCKLLQNPDW